MNTSARFVLVASALTLSLAALAQAPAISVKPSPAPVSQPGANSPSARPQNSGIPEKITRAEAIKRATDQFDLVDTNHDGVVTRDEILAFQENLRKSAAALSPSKQGLVNGAPPVTPAAPVAKK